MQYFSTNRKSPEVAFREAVLNGQPDDKGLYFPKAIPQFSQNLLDSLADLSNAEIAYQIIAPYVGDAISEQNLIEICEQTVNFPFPLVEISDIISALELFHGPTLAFKDVGARFMSRCLQYFSKKNSQRTLVIVATSGDTGGAVANGFHNVDGIEVVILYPKGKVSRVQELQLTTLGGNVITLEVQGNFDDCQNLAKQALADVKLRKQVILTSANSINVARWLPQQFYYAFAMKHWTGEPPIISVPSGNFGNLAAGLLAYMSGLPVENFIAACNANDVIPEYFRTGRYIPKNSIATLSNAMDVGDPSNFTRILQMFGENNQLRNKLNAVSISDELTARTISEVFAQSNYILDPHGAVAYAALSDFLEINPDKRGFILETAHPIKFDVVETIVGNYNVIPETVKQLESKSKNSIEIDVSYDKVKEIIFDRI